MPPKSRVVAVSSSRQQPGFFGSLYQELKSPENASVVKGVAVFAVAVTFLHSSWSELLVPTF